MNTKLIGLLNKAIPEVIAVDISQWDMGETGRGIWFRGSECYSSKGERIFNYYAEDNEMVHPTVQKLLDKHNYYAQPYDCGTLMAYPA